MFQDSSHACAAQNDSNKENGFVSAVPAGSPCSVTGSPKPSSGRKVARRSRDGKSMRMSDFVPVFGNCKAQPSPAPSGFCYAKPTSLPEGGCGKSHFFASAGRVLVAPDGNRQYLSPETTDTPSHYKNWFGKVLERCRKTSFKKFSDKKLVSRVALGTPQPIFLCKKEAQRKIYQKETPIEGFRALRSAPRATRP